MIKIIKEVVTEINKKGLSNTIFVHYEYSETEGQYSNEVEMMEALEYKYNNIFDYDCKVKFITALWGSRYETYYYKLSPEYMEKYGLLHEYRLHGNKLHGINGPESIDKAICL